MKPPYINRKVGAPHRFRPGGNATGFTPIVSSLGGKWVELLKEIAPHIARVTLLFNPPTATFVQDYLIPPVEIGDSCGRCGIP